MRSCLPMTRRDDVKCRLLRGLGEVRFEKGVFKYLQGEISAYFAGACVNFSEDTPIVINCESLFAQRVLRACRDISYGNTMSYGEVARRTGAAGGGRAVGGVLAKNPLPLIIPCHRVTCANGRLGGFSPVRDGQAHAAGGIRLKKRMLELENVEPRVFSLKTHFLR